MNRKLQKLKAIPELWCNLEKDNRYDNVWEKKKNKTMCKPSVLKRTIEFR